MGVSSNQARLMTLTARTNDLELRAQQISNQKAIMALQTQSLSETYSNALLEATNTETGEVDSFKLTLAQRNYDKETSQLAAKEKILDLQLTQINTEHEAAQTEYESVKSLVKDNTSKAFSLFG